MDQRRRTLLQRLPDCARWVETRSMLLSGDCRVLADPDEFQGGKTAIVCSTRAPLASVIGSPAARTLSVMDDFLPDDAEVLAQREDFRGIRPLLSGWRGKEVILHELPPDNPTPKSRAVVNLLAGKAELRLHTIPARLKEELTRVLDYAPVAAAFVDGRPVSFCCPAASTETLWDVSIDTLAAYRRQGWAFDCASYMIRLMAARGKRPVWGAYVSNRASLALAAKLGFRETDRIKVFRRKDQ